MSECRGYAIDVACVDRTLLRTIAGVDFARDLPKVAQLRYCCVVGGLCFEVLFLSIQARKMLFEEFHRVRCSDTGRLSIFMAPNPMQTLAVC